jgi:hypothetical protein
LFLNNFRLDENEISVEQSSTPIDSNTSSNELDSNTINRHSLEQNSDNSVHQTEPDDILGNNSLIKQVEKSCVKILIN